MVFFFLSWLNMRAMLGLVFSEQSSQEGFIYWKTNESQVLRNGIIPDLSLQHLVQEGKRPLISNSTFRNVGKVGSINLLYSFPPKEGEVVWFGLESHISSIAKHICIVQGPTWQKWRQQDISQFQGLVSCFEILGRKVYVKRNEMRFCDRLGAQPDNWASFQMLEEMKQDGPEEAGFLFRQPSYQPQIVIEKFLIVYWAVA